MGVSQLYLQMPLFEIISDISISDSKFDQVFSEKLRGSTSYHHWTPVEVCVKASAWLSEFSNSICDIGSGPGKFCLIGGATTAAHYTGIEYRSSFVREATTIAQKYVLDDRVEFLCEDIVNADFESFDGFYFYNPYLEHLYNKAITPEIEVSKQKVSAYNRFVRGIFENVDRPVSLVTYDNLFSVIPLDEFELKRTAFDEKLCLYQNF